MDKIATELSEIRRILDSSHLIEAVKREVRNIRKNGVRVIGGEFANNPEYDVVVMHNCGEETNGEIGRRLRSSIQNIEVNDQIDRIANNIIGIRHKEKDAD